MGWHDERDRHSMAAKGIKTGRRKRKHTSKYYQKKAIKKGEELAVRGVFAIGRGAVGLGKKAQQRIEERNKKAREKEYKKYYEATYGKKEFEKIKTGERTKVIDAKHKEDRKRLKGIL